LRKAATTHLSFPNLPTSNSFLLHPRSRLLNLTTVQEKKIKLYTLDTIIQNSRIYCEPLSDLTKDVDFPTPLLRKLPSPLSFKRLELRMADVDLRSEDFLSLLRSSPCLLDDDDDDAVVSLSLREDDLPLAFPPASLGAVEEER